MDKQTDYEKKQAELQAEIDRINRAIKDTIAKIAKNDPDFARRLEAQYVKK